MPVPQFALVTGRPETTYPEGKVHPWWSPIERFRFNFTAGKFDQTYEDGIVYNERNPRFMFKIQAEGYKPFISRVVEIDEGEVRFDVQLQQASQNLVTVLLPNGQPAVNTEIQLARPGQQVAIASGGLAENYGGVYLRTDRDGKFDLQPEEDTVRVFAANNDGLGSATPQELADRPVLQLQPWARLEGIMRRRGDAAAGLRIYLSSPPISIGPGQQLREPLVSLRIFAVTDAGGNFSFTKAPPGAFELMYIPAHGHRPAQSSRRA